MHKIWLIIKREYLTRVRNKTFILSTILLPLFFIGFIAASAYFSLQSEDKHNIAVNDANGIFKSSFRSDSSLTFEFPSGVTANNFSDKGFSGYLDIPQNFESEKVTITLFSAKSLGLAAEEKIRNQLNTAI